MEIRERIANRNAIYRTIDSKKHKAGYLSYGTWTFWRGHNGSVTGFFRNRNLGLFPDQINKIIRPELARL